MKASKNEKTIFLASSGGHLTQILQLEKMFVNKQYLLITEKNEITKSLLQQYNVKFVPYTSRTNKFIFLIKFAFLCLMSIYYLLIFNPKYVITTGAGTSIPICYLAKLFRKKVIFIESFARVNSKSLSGKIIYPIADLFIVQWEEMVKIYPNAINLGSIY